MEPQALKKTQFSSQYAVKQNLILLHGLFGTLSNWQSVVKEFSNDYHVYTPELPLFDSIISESHLNRLVKYLEQFIDEHHIENPILVGNSLGGHVAILYTLKTPRPCLQINFVGQLRSLRKHLWKFISTNRGFRIYKG